jgi:hypothetical protein
MIFTPSSQSGLNLEKQGGHIGEISAFEGANVFIMGNVWQTNLAELLAKL